MSNPETPLSASRIKTAQSCSWLYWAKYKLSLPDSSNDGAKRGSICHLVFELLGEPRRKKTYQKIIEEEDIFAVESVKRLVLKHAKKSGVDDEENIEMIKEMTLNGLEYDFYGENSNIPTEAISEKDFEIVHVSEDEGIKYKIKGFIDKLFLYKENKFALIRDFKSSKQVFKGKEISDNLQDYMYSLAVKHLYPDYQNRQSEFLFLKFDLDDKKSAKLRYGANSLLDKKREKGCGVVLMQPISEDDLSGFEYQLSGMQAYLDNFTEKDSCGNLAATQPFPSDNSFSGPLQCGFAKVKGQLKKDGTPMWHCPMKFDFHYIAILNESGKLVKSYHENEFEISLVPEKHTFEKRYYAGCPAFNKKAYSSKK
jgi:hypothetical protein